MHDIEAGEAVLRAARITGITTSGRLSADFFDIESPKSLIGVRFEIHHSPSGDVPETSKIEMIWLFGGESMPAMAGMSSAQIVGSGGCPCGTQ